MYEQLLYASPLVRLNLFIVKTGTIKLSYFLF